ncbi:MAG: redox-regulated ATPase YchF [Candidatus Bathyarchaeota archaeon]|nr:redox-regulated ATPase YchF [Candidatus Bathyarchaeota archaeon]
MAKIVGLVGKANVGKSTFFAAATLKPVEIAGFPFTTIKADMGVAYVRTPCVCQEMGVTDNPQNSACVDGIRLIPVDLIDTPGLIPGAHMGKGLGNQFLDEVRRADALIVVADASGMTDINGQVCDPLTHDPIEDVQMFENEFDLWLTALIKKDWDRISRTAQSVKEHIAKHMEEKLTGLGINRYQITQAVNNAGLNGFNSANWTDEEFNQFIVQLRKTSKPLIVAANKADREGADENVERIREAGYLVVPTCAEAELALRRAAEAGLVDYTPGDKDFKINNPEKLNKSQLAALERIREKVFQKYGGTGLQEVLNTAFYSLLDMITVYPVEDAEKLTNHQGHVLPDCFLVPKGTTAKQFAGVIHTELAESFIHAIDARSKRRLGDTYILEDNDIIQIVSAKSRR